MYVVVILAIEFSHANIKFVMHRNPLCHPVLSFLRFVSWSEINVMFSLEQEFWDSVKEGYQAASTWHPGCLHDNGK